MALRDFPLTSEIERRVRALIDQALGETGNLTWDPDEIAHAMAAENDFLWAHVTALDRGWGVRVTDAQTVTSGTRATDLPADCRSIRKIMFVDGAYETVDTHSPSWDHLGRAFDAWKHLVDQNQIYFLRDPPGGTLRIVYEIWPPPVFHGLAQNGSTTFITLAEYESDDDDRFNSVTIFTTENQGAGQSPTITDYVGNTRRASAVFSPAVDGTTKYACRPLLPRDAADAFVYGTAARLTEKLDGERANQFALSRERYLKILATAMVNYEKQEPMQVINDSHGSHGDDMGYF